jgi:hypothetical protein
MKLNKRGKRVRAVFLFGIICALIWWIVTGFWWTEDGICIGTMAECLGDSL